MKLMQVRHRPALALALALALVLLAVAGCGSSGGSGPVGDSGAAAPSAPQGDAGAAASPAPAPAAPADPILIGASVSLTGNYARTGQNMLNGYNLALDKINQAGGVLGRQLELKVYDDQSEPETSGRLYEKLITEDKVDLVIGPYASPVSLVASTIAERHQTPIIIAGASASDIWGRGYDYTFGMYTLATTYSHGPLIFAKEQGLRTIAIVNEATAFAQDVAKGAREKAAELGLEVIHEEEYTKGTTDFTATLLKLKSLNPDVLVGGTYLPESVELTRQSKDLGFAPPMMFYTVGPGLPDFWTNLGEDAQFVLGDAQWEPVMKAEGLPEFLASYEQEFGEEPGYHAAGGYAGVQVLAAAIDAAGSTDPSLVREALSTITVPTVFGQWQADETGANVGKPHFMVQWIDGRREVVWPAEYASHETVFPFPSWDGR